MEQIEGTTAAISKNIGQTVTLHGSIYQIRRMKQFAFIILRCQKELVQCVYSPEFSHFPLEDVREESAVLLTGQVVSEPRSKTGFELHASHLEILSAPEAPSPLVINHREIDAGLNTVLNYRPLTLRNQKLRSVFLIQSAIGSAIRSFLENRDFAEIHTPKLVASGAEGGADMFELDYFGQKAYLAQSPQFYKQMMAGALERVYEIGPVYRAERHDTSRHLNEYTGVDLEMAYIRGFEDIMELETALLAHVFNTVSQTCADLLNYLEISVPEIHTIPSVTFREAKERIAAHTGKPVLDWQDLEPEEERTLSRLVEEETGSQLVFVTHYPTAKRPFYTMESPEDPSVTLSFDLLLRGLEITTGGQRIHSYREQVDKLCRLSLEPSDFEDYLMIHRHGMPPHGGLGMGLERLTARLLNLENVREASLFPRDCHRLRP